MAGESILIVEDDGILALDLKETLEEIGYTVLEPVATGRQAISAVTAGKPDLIIMDIELPGEMKGIEAADRIRLMTDVPVIYLTGYSQDPLFNQAKETAPYGYLVKPVPERELITAIEIALYRNTLDRKLRESERRYRLVADNVRDVIWTMDENYKLTYVSPSIRYLRGLEPEEAMEESLEDKLPPEMLKVVLDHHARGKEAEARGQKDYVAYLEIQQKHRGGSLVWVEILVQRMHTEDGQKVGYFGISRDISERKRMENELKSSQANLKTLIESTEDIIWSVDLNFGLVTYNTKLEQDLLSNFGTRARPGATPDAIFPPERAVLWPPLYTRAVTEGPFRVEDTLVDGRCLELSFNPIIQDNELTGVSVFGKDITERKKSEEDRLIFEQQIQQSHKMEAVGILAGGIAHDFNNILSTLIGNAEMSLEESNIENIRYNLGQILKGSHRARDLVRQILSFSRPRKHEQKTIDMAEIISETIKLLKAIIPSNISIRQNLACRDCFVYGDPGQIHQVVVNLCTNAAYAMHEKGGKLGLKLARVSAAGEKIPEDLEPGKYIRLSISETGHGIDPFIMDKIFDPFFTTKNPGQGTGLGLSVVYGIVKDHGGSISIESTQGKGSVFHVFLPVSTGTKPCVEDVGPESLRGHERILFVDDEPQIGEIVKKVLLILGYDLTVCENPLGALKLFRQEPSRFDLVITDLTMPNMTGKDLARAIHRIRQDIPVILSTGHNEAPGLDDLARYGIKELLIKPVSLKEYAITVRKVLDESNK